MKKVNIKETSVNHRVQEAMKSLRTNIQFCGADKKVIMLTSCISGEGKSETSLRLAMSLAELNRRVILVDTDLRRSVLLSKISYSHDGETLGLTHFLTGQASLRDVVCTTNVPNFHMILAGPFPPNPVELLSSHNGASRRLRLYHHRHGASRHRHRRRHRREAVRRRDTRHRGGQDKSPLRVRHKTPAR